MSLFRYQAFDMVYLFFVLKTSTLQVLLWSFCIDEEISLGTANNPLQPKRTFEESALSTLLYSRFAHFTLPFLWWLKGFLNCGRAFLFILLCGKEYVQRLNSWLHIVLYSVFLKLSRVNHAFYFRYMTTDAYVFKFSSHSIILSFGLVTSNYPTWNPHSQIYTWEWQKKCYVVIQPNWKSGKENK